MRAYEFPAKVTVDGKLPVPDSVLKTIPDDQAVRVIVLVNDQGESEDGSWAHLTAEQFLAGYTEADSIYDRR